MINPRLQDWIFVGLGNPGPQYERTRHNMGYLVVKAFAYRMGWNFKEDKRFQALVKKGIVEEKALHLLLPTTYMNASGMAIKRYLDFFKLEVGHLVVVMDDIALPFGEMKFKTMGSTGGHNGLKSIQAHLGTTHYMRLKMGIGHPGEKILSDYVLDPFSKVELEQLDAFVDRGIDVLKRLIKEDPSQVMTTVNTKAPPKMNEERGLIDLTNPL